MHRPTLESLSAIWLATIAEGVAVAMFLGMVGVWCLVGSGRI